MLSAERGEDGQPAMTSRAGIRPLPRGGGGVLLFAEPWIEIHFRLSGMQRDIFGVVGGQAAEQIIAGVVLSERLAVTMYGAIHRAQFAGQRNLRGLVVDPKILEDDSFRIALTDPKKIETVTRLEHGKHRADRRR